MIENWVFSLFFCAGELWGGVVISVLFWTLANEVCSVSDAKTIYPLMGIAANIALVVAGNYMKFINNTLTQVRRSRVSLLSPSPCTHGWAAYKFLSTRLGAPCCGFR